MAISLRGFSKTFSTVGKHATPVEAVRNVDLEIGAGSIVVLIGPSGCGKTTLLRSIGGLIEPTTGQVRVGDQTPQQAREHKLFGLIPQAPTLLPWRTVRQNANLLLEVNRSVPKSTQLSSSEIDQLLVDVGLGGFEHTKVRQLSGGMQQRVALVRAFALGAPVLLFDEPFAALDEFTRSDMRQLLLQLWERTKPTIIFTTHSLEEAVLLADRVVVMAPRPGRIVADLTIDLSGAVETSFDDIEDSQMFADQVKRVRHALKESFMGSHTISAKARP